MRDYVDRCPQALFSSLDHDHEYDSTARDSHKFNVLWYSFTSDSITRLAPTLTALINLKSINIIKKKLVFAFHSIGSDLILIVVNLVVRLQDMSL